MIRFTTIPLRHEGVLEDNTFHVPESPATEDVLNVHALLYQVERTRKKAKRSGRPKVDPELELYNYVADTWPFISLNSR